MIHTIEIEDLIEERVKGDGKEMREADHHGRILILKMNQENLNNAISLIKKRVMKKPIIGIIGAIIETLTTTNDPNTIEENQMIRYIPLAILEISEYHSKIVIFLMKEDRHMTIVRTKILIIDVQETLIQRDLQETRDHPIVQGILKVQTSLIQGKMIGLYLKLNHKENLFTLTGTKEAADLIMPISVMIVIQNRVKDVLLITLIEINTVGVIIIMIAEVTLITNETGTTGILMIIRTKE